MNGKHYVTTLRRRHLRRHIVTRVEYRPLPGRVGRVSSVRIAYPVVGRYFTRAAAERFAHEQNRKRGHTP